MLIGSGPGEAEIRLQTEALGLAGCVEFCGPLAMEQYGPILANADIGLSPYCGWPEYSGLKIFDYKAAGLPAIASGVNGQPRSVRDGETGLVAPPCARDALFDAILRLLADPDLRRRMGRRARQEAEERHGWQHTVDNIECLLFDTIESQMREETQ
jgi:glycosyltransferase involved in cell wall biosynthesis